MSNRIKYGSDPEFFAVQEIDGRFVAIPPYFFRKTLGVKTTLDDKDVDKKHPVFMKASGWMIHEDGRAFEMGISPSYDPKDIFDRIQEAKMAFSGAVLQRFPEHCLPELLAHPTVEWDVERWKNMPEDFFFCTRFGCDEDSDAFNMEARGQVMDASLHPEAYGGGHFHFSGIPEIRKDPILSIQNLAMTVGCAATFYSALPELEKRRTFLYGVPGRFRLQDYPTGEQGIEYRTPSNSWTNSWDVAKEIFEWGKVGIEELLLKGLGKELFPVLGDSASQAILECDQILAGQVLDYISERV